MLGSVACEAVIVTRYRDERDYEERLRILSEEEAERLDLEEREDRRDEHAGVVWSVARPVEALRGNA